MAEAPGDLTASARAALHWAWIASHARGQDLASQPDSLDLLAGIALAQLRDNAAQDFFTHFRLPLGAVLTSGGVPRYTGNALLASAAAVPEELPEPRSGEVAAVLAVARGSLPQPDDGLITVDMLFGALLEAESEASRTIRRQLSERGQDLGPLVESYREHLRGRDRYADFLREHHARLPITITPFAADQPLARRSSGGGDGEPDLVGIGPEVDAFAYLVASRRLVPPLAVGLFGDWGAGKSYFLRSLQRRIDAITAASRAEPGPFHAAVAQVEFNAWQYVEGDLWASLLEHLFRNLRTSPEDDDDLLGERHRHWMRQVDQNAVARLEAQTHRRVLERRRQVAAAEVGRRHAERDVAVAELERRLRERPLAGWKPSPELVALRDEALRRTGLTGVASEAEGLAAELNRSAQLLRDTGVLLAPMRQRGARFTAALVAVVLAAPVLAIVLDVLDFSAVSAAAATLGWLLATAAGYLKIGNDAVQLGLSKVTEAQAMLTAETEAARAEHESRIAAAEAVLDDVSAQLATAITREHDLEREAGVLAEELAAVTPAKVLNEFIAERVGSEDYRRRLGIPAVVRRDLERLSRLVAQQRAGSGEPAVDRVVLYIDDLDRCPADVVVKVLEAVHLLLAFPLFVVVVAVDSRWLEESLREHFPQLRTSGAGPGDYLEKIFQVPFWVRPVEPALRRQVVRGLLGPSVLANAAESTAEAGNGVVLVSESDRAEFERVAASFETTRLPDRDWAAAADLSVTAGELARLEELTDLLGATPRALKRFVNVYLLVKAMGRGRGWDVPGAGQLALLLAVSTTAPDLVGAIAPATDAGPLPLGKTAAAGDARLARWLDEHPHWRDVDMSAVHRWTEIVQRFTFVRPQ